MLHASVHATISEGAAHAWVEPFGLAHRISVKGGDVVATVGHVPRERGVTLRVLYPAGALAPDAPYARHVHDRILAATEAREHAAAARTTG